MPTFALDDYYYGYYMTCVECAGTGVNLENKISDCDDCEGDGILYFKELCDELKQYYLINPSIIFDATCPKCKGVGCFPLISEKACSLCDGQGYISLYKAVAWINEHKKPLEIIERSCIAPSLFPGT